MNVLVVGLLSIAVYLVVLAVWLRIDKNRSEYVGNGKEVRR